MDNPDVALIRAAIVAKQAWLKRIMDPTRIENQS
jgi:hypothetical protein